MTDRLSFLLRGLALLLGLAVCLPLQAGTLYKAVGPDGKTYYTDQPPPAGRVTRSIDFADEPAGASRQSPGTAGELPVIYTTPSCGYCRQAKAWMSSHGVRYRESNVETDSGQRAYRQAGGGGGVPYLVWQGQRVMGFSVDQYQAMFRP